MPRETRPVWSSPKGVGMTKQRYQLVIVIDAPKGRTPAEVGHAALQALEDTEGLTVVELSACPIERHKGEELVKFRDVTRIR